MGHGEAVGRDVTHPPPRPPPLPTLEEILVGEVDRIVGSTEQPLPDVPEVPAISALAPLTMDPKAVVTACEFAGYSSPPARPGAFDRCPHLRFAHQPCEFEFKLLGAQFSDSS